MMSSDTEAKTETKPAAKPAGIAVTIIIKIK